MNYIVLTLNSAQYLGVFQIKLQKTKITHVEYTLRSGFEFNL